MAAEVRDLGFLAWKNDMAWLEPQKGVKWETAIEEENKRFKESLKGLPLNKFKSELMKSIPHSHTWSWRGWSIERGPFSPEQTWTHRKSRHVVKCWDADMSMDGRWFAAAVQDSNGYERFTVEILEIRGQTVRHHKTMKMPCGPFVGFHGNLLVYLESSKDLRYDIVHLLDIESDTESEIYRISDPTENLSIERGESGCVHVIKDDFVKKSLGMIHGNTIKWPVKDVSHIVVVNHDYWVIDQKVDFTEDPLEAMSLKGGWAITKSYGIRTIWQIKPAAVKSMIVVWGEVGFDLRDPSTLHIRDMRYEPYTLHTNHMDWKLSNTVPYPLACSYYRHPAPTFIVYPKAHAKALLVIAYGAYGSPTKVGNMISMWNPLLERGWAIATVCVPGSGDHDTAWKTAGQGKNRQNAIDHLSAAVKNLQEELDISPRRTCLYGRSAGGLLVISTAIQHKGLVGALYVESPYVDVLRTISNPKLPLTALETMEFGIGSNPSDVLMTAQWSPMEHIPAKGLPDLFVVARSDRADLEVYPYEVVKFIRRMRSTNDCSKLLFVEDGMGHFATGLESRAADLALLEKWRNSPDSFHEKFTAVRTKNVGYKYTRMALSRKNRKNKNNASRKNRKNKNDPMMGGRRRKSRASRKSRKARKSRRHH